MKQQTKPTEKFNVQRRCEEIHAQYGTSEMANYRIQQMCDKIAQDAFDEGKQSVIDNMELSWNGGYYTPTMFNIDYTIVYSPVSKRYFIQFGEEFLDGDYSSKDAAKQAANGDYKNRIKKALGL